MTGFEPAASSSRTKRATGLRYIPNNFYKIKSLQIIELLLSKQRLFFPRTDFRKGKLQQKFTCQFIWIAVGWNADHNFVLGFI